jgi:hypothetical protein
MKVKRLPLIIVSASILVFSSFIAFYPTGAPAGYTGSPGDGKNCTECHGGTATTISGWITSNIPAEGYLPGQTYQITATNNNTGSGKYGFEISPQSASGTLLGTLTAGANNQLVGNNKYVTHVSASTSINTWTFNWTAPAAGTGNVTFYGAFARNHPGPVRLSTLTVGELTAPGQAGPISGSSSVCVPGSESYSISPVNGATSYVWTVPAGATIASGQGSTSVSVNFGTNAVSGVISVYGTNAAGNGAPSNLTVTVNQIAEIPATPTGPAQVDLNNTTSSDYTTAGSANADSYQWEISPVEAGTITGNGLTATVQWGTYLGIVTVRVKAINTCGDSNWSEAVQTEVINTTGITKRISGSLSVFPNPGRDIFHITLPQNIVTENPSFRVINGAGNVVASGLLEISAGQQAVLNLTGNPAGLYFVEVSISHKQYASKIFIQ